MPAPHLDQSLTLRTDARDDLLGAPVDQALPELDEHVAEAPDRHTGEGATRDDRRGRGHSTPRHRQGARAPPPELVAVSPRGKLGALRLSDPHQRRPLSQPSQPDVVGRDSAPRIAIEPLRLFDRFPTLLEWREIPALAGAAHHPQATPPWVERQTFAHRKGFDRFVSSERFVAEDAGREHRRGLRYPSALRPRDGVRFRPAPKERRIGTAATLALLPHSAT